MLPEGKPAARPAPGGAATVPSPVRGAGSETTAPARASGVPDALGVEEADGAEGAPDVALLALGAPLAGVAEAADGGDAEAAGVALGAGPVSTGVAAGVAATGAACGAVTEVGAETGA